MSSDVLANFSCLDELTQVIYQSFYRFVVLSNVSDDRWTVHLGLSGPEGRWWRGNWGEADILQVVGLKSSDKLLEAFANKLAETFVQGELYVGDWSDEEGANIKLTLGPASKKPLHISLVELSPKDAASYATGIFLEIALQAQSRRCRLYPPQYTSSIDALPPPRAVSDQAIKKPIASKPTRTQATLASEEAAGSSSPSASNKNAQDEIKALKEQLVKQKIAVSAGEPIARPVAGPRPLKGASLANPNKKARKYQAIEFESDDE